MTKFESFEQIIRRLRSPDGCPWDREQTHDSLKPACIEEAAELLGAINMYARTGDAANMKEELGDLLLQVLGGDAQHIALTGGIDLRQHHHVRLLQFPVKVPHLLP